MQRLRCIGCSAGRQTFACIDTLILGLAIHDTHSVQLSLCAGASNLQQWIVQVEPKRRIDGVQSGSLSAKSGSKLDQLVSHEVKELVAGNMMHVLS